MSADLLANAERPSSERPPSSDDGTPSAGYWHGSAFDELRRLRVRAEEAERREREALALVDRLVAALRAWRPHT